VATTTSVVLDQIGTALRIAIEIIRTGGFAFAASADRESK
jgi:hypothetical protein